jgi:hypothetical protein
LLHKAAIFISIACSLYRLVFLNIIFEALLVLLDVVLEALLVFFDSCLDFLDSGSFDRILFLGGVGLMRLILVLLPMEQLLPYGVLMLFYNGLVPSHFSIIPDSYATHVQTWRFCFEFSSRLLMFSLG